jgi:DNA-binding response OmpR family regulator
MGQNQTGRVLVAHRRVAVLRMLCANLRAEGLAVRSLSSGASCLAALRESALDALVLDADLLRDGMPDGAALATAVREGSPPVLLISFDPADRVLARSLGHVPFVSRPDNIDEVTRLVQDLVAVGQRRRAGAAAPS